MVVNTHTDNPFQWKPPSDLLKIMKKSTAEYNRQHSTIPDKIFGTKWSNPVKLDNKRKVWYLF